MSGEHVSLALAKEFPAHAVTIASASTCRRTYLTM